LQSIAINKVGSTVILGKWISVKIALIFRFILQSIGIKVGLLRSRKINNFSKGFHFSS